ncbi:MAG: CapA family protein [Anaerolineae bacterium]|nr:MAG: CapA family protein [Anaerolineae bacterium]
MRRLTGEREGDKEEKRGGLLSPLFFLSLLLVLSVVSARALPVPLPEGIAPDLSAYPWLYLRDGEPLAVSEKVVEVIAVGDVMLGRGVTDEPQPFAAVTPWLRAADLALGNLECVITARSSAHDEAQVGTAQPGPYRLRAPPSAVAALRDAGFDLIGLANNHALDLGPAALAETVSRLQATGIATVGVGPDVKAATQPLIREVGGLRLAFLAFNAVPDPEDRSQDDGWTRADWDRERATATIAAARSQADAAVVSVHWGYEYEWRPDPAQRDAARAMLDASADLIVGHHPHVVQGTQASAAHFVAYSLGNLVFDQQQGEMRQGLALRAVFDGQGLRAVQALPVWAGPRPRLMNPDEAASLLARIQPPARRVGFDCAQAVSPNSVKVCRPVAVPQTLRTGLFFAGAADLTGDGVPEQVQRVKEQVIIYHDGVERWRGLPEWRVVDLALGDPNGDGRSELLLALWKPDAEGGPRSHPFIVGYRQGAYRVLWGGSAVADPILEVELGDVNGDGVQELIVLEEHGGGPDRAVTVWRWHGWGFSLAWRSPPGRYRDLALIASQADRPAIISVAAEP